MTAAEYYDKGNKHRQEGNLSEALNCYMAAAEIDPNSPAKAAAEIMKNIINFYCKDIYNP